MRAAAQSDQNRTQAEIKSLDKAVAEVRSFCLSLSGLAQMGRLLEFLLTSVVGALLLHLECLTLEPGENAQLRQWRSKSRKTKPAGHGAAQGGARDLRPGAGREPGGDAAGGGGEEQAQQVAQLNAGNFVPE